MNPETRSKEYSSNENHRADASEAKSSCSSPERAFDGKLNKHSYLISEESSSNFHHHHGTRRQSTSVKINKNTANTSSSSSTEETESSVHAAKKHISFSSGSSSGENHFKEKSNNNNFNTNGQEGRSTSSNLECKGKVTEDEKKNRTSSNTGNSSSQEENGTSSSSVRNEHQSHCVSRSDEFSVKNEGAGSSSEEGRAALGQSVNESETEEKIGKLSEERYDTSKHCTREDEDNESISSSSGSDTMLSNRNGRQTESETGYAGSNEDSGDQQEYDRSPSSSENDQKRINRINRHSYTRQSEREDSMDLSDSTEISSSDDLEDDLYQIPSISSSPEPNRSDYSSDEKAMKQVASSMYITHSQCKTARRQNYDTKNHSSARHDRHKSTFSSMYKQPQEKHSNKKNHHAAPMIRNSRVIFERTVKKSHQHQGNSFSRKRNHQETLVSHSSIKPRSSAGKRKSVDDYHNSTPIYYIGYDSMAHVLSYLEPPEVHTFLEMPLSKTWQAIYTSPKDLWKILCSTYPFHANLNEDKDSDSESESSGSFPMVTSQSELRHIFGKYRLLYTSFVQCVIYLEKLKEDVKQGVPVANLGKDAPLPPGLKYLKQSAKRMKIKATGTSVKCDDLSNYSSSELISPLNNCDGTDQEEKKKSKQKKRLMISKSQLTDRLFGPCADGSTPGQLDLPISCAIYSVVNWMVAFSDVQGIQILCLKVIPLLLEDENQRITAQKAGLTDIVLQEMVLFPDNVHLHTAAFHAIVLLARPLGGREGMLFHSAMINASGIFSVRNMNGRNGIAVMLDSMRRFNYHEFLQAMGCWSMVNIALIPSQKTMLVKLGGISVTLTAMIMHPHSAEVQFRAAFALINLVIPSEPLMVDSEVDAIQEHLGSVNDVTERELLDENVAQIVNLVVVAMKNFCTSEAIMNRCCLVLHNICNVEDYHTTLLWTPNCYHMLEWALVNYRNDLVLQQSAQSTLQRLQLTLANDSELRTRFVAAIRSQGHEQRR